MISDSEYYEMLLPETRKVLEEGALEEKIAYAQVDKFIPYSRAAEILKIMEDIFTRPRKHRMPCILLYGESNNGKSSIIKEFNRWHPPTDGWDSDALPVVVTEVSNAETSHLYDNILQNILIPFKKSHTLSQKEQLIKYHFGQLGTKMLFIDEIHTILMGTAAKRAHFMNAVKALSNELEISIVIAGVSTALMITSSDEQLQSRFRPVKLPKWGLNEEYATLLASLELMLPFRKHPGISTNEKLATKIFDMSEGILGYIVDIVEKCAVRSLEKGKERINEEILKEIDFAIPSEQREAYRG